MLNSNFHAIIIGKNKNKVKRNPDYANEGQVKLLVNTKLPPGRLYSMSSDIKRVKAAAHLVHKAKGTLIAPREVLEKIEVLAPEAVTTLESLMRESKADSVRLKAALEILGLAGVTKETRLTVTTETTELNDSQLNNRLAELLGKAQGEVIEGEAKDITPEGETNPEDGDGDDEEES